MNNVKSISGLFELSIPDGWAFEQEESLASIYSEENGVGALQISTYIISTGTHIDIRSELLEYVRERISKDQASLVDKVIIYDSSAFIELIEDNSFWRYQIMFVSSALLLITYNCSASDAEIKNKDIDRIIKSIQIIGSEV